MPVQFSNDKPIFLQLAEMLKGDIISGKFKPNDKLPSVREFAFEFQVNPNTVQKALQLLEDDGLIFTDRTNGKFVADNKDRIKAQKDKIINLEINQFFEKMTNLGLSIDEIKELIKNSGE